MEKMSLSIEGMSCAHCVARVKQALAATPGVHVDDVSVGAATVSYDAGATSPEKIRGAVSAAGYPAK
jgi:copper chaperone